MPRKTAASAVAETPRVTDAPEAPAVEAVQAAFPVAAPAPKPRAAKLTLSQRRALVVLGEDGRVVRKGAFNALPYRHLVEVGLAVEVEELAFELTEAGRARAASINPAYRDWKAGGSVKGGSFAPDRLGAAKRAVEDARFEALASNPGVSR